MARSNEKSDTKDNPTSRLSAACSVIASGFALSVLGMSALLAPWIAPQNPFDPLQLTLANAFSPPVWGWDGDQRFLLGTDDQGRDMLSSVLFGLRISLSIGVAAVGFALAIGVPLGLAAGYCGGWIDTVVMRFTDIQLTIPAILVALVIDGLLRIYVDQEVRDELVLYVLVCAIGLSDWPRYARITRGAVMVEQRKEYVDAACCVGVPPIAIVIRHILPNVVNPILVIAAAGLAFAITAEATLSFLGVGLPPTQPSLGTMIRNGQNFLYSGEWWIALFPSMALVALVLAVNILGDRLRDAFDPQVD